MASFRQAQVLVNPFPKHSTFLVTGVFGAFLPKNMKTHVVKPIFGQKIERVFNGISKDEEDWFATAFSDRWEFFITHHGMELTTYVGP